MKKINCRIGWQKWSGEDDRDENIGGAFNRALGYCRGLWQKAFNILLVSANTIYIDDQMNFPTPLTLKEILEEGQRFYHNWDHELASRFLLTIFDEPTTVMDAVVRKGFYRALLKDYLAHPRTILLSTHHLEEMEDVLEEVVLLHDGGDVFPNTSQ